MRTVSALKMVWMARVPRSVPPASCCRAWGISSSAVLGMRNRGAIWKPCACVGGGATLAAMGAPMPGVRYWFCSPFTAKVARRLERGQRPAARAEAVLVDGYVDRAEGERIAAGAEGRRAAILGTEHRGQSQVVEVGCSAQAWVQRT